MGETKPIFALDLSNEGVALWHRKGSAGWVALGQVALSDPDLELRLIEMRDRAPVRGRSTVVRVPRTEVLLTKVRLGVFEGDAALSHARKQVAELTPYPLDEVAYDLGEKGFGNMAPVGVVARKTLTEADAFARSHGFDPVYFTTQYGEREFPREPRFYLAEPKQMPAIMGWVIPWAAAAAIGLTAGFLGYSWLSAPGEAVTTALDRPGAPGAIASAPAKEHPAEGEADPHDEESTQVAALETRALDVAALSDVAPSLPPQASDLVVIAETPYPQVTARAPVFPPVQDAPGQLRLVNLRADEPALVAQSTREKTNSLQIAEARRDLPEVGINAEIVGLLQDSMFAEPPETVEPVAPIQIVRLTAPQIMSDLVELTALPPAGESKAQVSETVTAMPDPPPRPVSLVVAEPGELTPTPEGTLGPGNILIFAGRPEAEPPARPGSELPPDPLAGFRPQLRPDGLVPADIVAAAAQEDAADPGDLLALADPALRAFRPRNRPNGLAPEPAAPETPADAPEALALADATDTTVNGNVSPGADGEVVGRQAPDISGEAEAETPLDLAAVAAAPPISTAGDTVASDPAPAGETETAAATPEDPADPAAETQPARTQPAAEPAFDSLAASDPALRVFRARTRPADLNTAIGGIFALADPALRAARPRPRPAGLPVPATRVVAETDAPTDATGTGDEPSDDTTLLAADPALRGFTPRERPATLDVPETAVNVASGDTPADAPLSGDALLAAADPALRGFSPRTRPATLDVPQAVLAALSRADAAADETPAAEIDAALAEVIAEDEQQAAARGAALLAAADPALAGFRARSRPGNLRVDVASPGALLALADPSLRGKQPRSRPRDLRVVAAASARDATPANPVAGATQQAVARSPMPKARPGKIASLAKRLQRRATTEAGDTRATASTPSAASGSSKPAPGPTKVNVANAASEKARFAKSRMSLVGVFGSSSARRALVRLPTGRYVKVKAGDRVSGWRISAIGESSLRISKGSRNQTLRVP